MASSFSSTISSMTKYKIVFLGDVYVGKTSLITRFMYDSFEMTYQATVGIDFLSKTFYLGDRTVRLQLWDTAGQERFRSLIPNYIRDSSIAVVVFDVTDKQTFDNIDRWVKDVHDERSNCANVFIIGNKIDREERKITHEMGMAKAKELGAMYLETSAKTGENVEEIFWHMASLLPNSDKSTFTMDNGSDINLANPSLDESSINSRCMC